MLNLIREGEDTYSLRSYLTPVTVADKNEPHGDGKLGDTRVPVTRTDKSEPWSRYKSYLPPASLTKNEPHGDSKLPVTLIRDTDKRESYMVTVSYLSPVTINNKSLTIRSRQVTCHPHL